MRFSTFAAKYVNCIVIKSVHAKYLREAKFHFLHFFQISIKAQFYVIPLLQILTFLCGACKFLFINIQYVTSKI